MDLELWGGHECTVNRTGSTWYDQTVLSGHQDRIDDLERFASLGLKALRYPLLWERVAPGHPDQQDWSWADARIGEIERLGMRPIVGLLHHGSGPGYTSLVDPGFPAKFAAYAAAAARRYPQVRDWTPINEPLTTARFSALYGHWYPHLRDEGAFWTALLNQIDGTRLAMAEIRRENPQARLIQTEDLGQTYSTPELEEQAAFDNHRRWLTWDLLTGKVTKDHPFWHRLCRFGLRERLEAISDAPCPPDVIGVNHYLTSERFLDHRIDRYPADKRGGNGFVDYADVEAVRALACAPGGLSGILEQAWDRYGLPLAVTESHNGCTREEQMRWIWEAWRAALGLRRRGAEVQAVTAWALLGSFDWNSLLTRTDGHYEPGAFDLHEGRPRETGITRMLRALGSDPALQSYGAKPPHPVLNAPGWWRRDIRLTYEPVGRTPQQRQAKRAWDYHQGRAAPVLITGATGTLGQAIARACEWRGLGYVLTSRAELDITSPDSVTEALRLHQPWAVINAAGWVRVDDAEAEVEACRGCNTEGALNLARGAAEIGAQICTFSTDLVFDGQAGRPYVESDPPNPLNAYGRSKAEAEAAILAEHPDALMVRSAFFFSAEDPYNYAAAVVRELSRGRRFDAPHDMIVTPTFVPDLARACLDLLIDGEAGVWHLTSGEPLSCFEFAVRIAEAADLPARLVRRVSWRDLGWPAERPANSALVSERGRLMPGLGASLEACARALRENAPYRGRQAAAPHQYECGRFIA